MGWAARTTDGAKRTPLRERLLNRPGAVAVVSGDRTTYPQFAYNVSTLRTTRGTQLLWQIAGGGGVARARNILCEQALEAEAGWVWFIDDDHVFSPDILALLLRHDRDIVVPTVLQRQPPHHLVGWEPFPVTPSTTDEELVALASTLERVHVDVRQTDLVELGHGGTAGMLIASEVLRAMPAPWFEWGRFGAASAGEDTWFCLKARRLGFRVELDPQTSMGHLNTCAIWPDTRFSIGGKVDAAYKFDFGVSTSSHEVDPFWAGEKLATR